MREVLVEIPNVTWEDVGGLEEVKRQLREMIEMPLENPAAFKRMGIRPAKGVLLYGPPGTGKTLLAKAVANESKANFISIKGPEIMSKWVGESEKAVRQAFKKAKQVAPSVVFLDEIDAIAPRTGQCQLDTNVTERVVNQLLTSMDGLETLERVTVIAATNRPGHHRPGPAQAGPFRPPGAHTRPGREGAPEHPRGAYQGHAAAGRGPAKHPGRQTEGFVGADLENLCREAAMIALREDKDAEMVEMKHFEAALKIIKPSVDKDIMKQYENIGKVLEKARLGGTDVGIYR